MTADPLGGAREVIVVLGGGPASGDAPHPSTVRRAARAATLALERPHAIVIASGGVTLPGAPSEAEQLAALLRERGVGPERILLEDGSLDTLGNAVCVAARYLALAAPRPLLVVTSPFHASRAKWSFVRALPAWDIDVAPSDPGPDDAARASTEPLYQRESERTFEGVTDGDLRALAARLRERWPAYAEVEALRDL